MPALQVRDFPEDLYEDLRARARENHRSITQETIIAVKQYLTDSRLKVINTEDLPSVAFEPEGNRAAQASDWYAIEYAAVHARDLPEIKRKRQRDQALAYLRSLPVVVDPDDFPTSAELIREERDNR